MAINYPTSLDSLTNPTAANNLSSPAHHTQHSDANDAIEALEAKVGVNSSAVTTSHDYKLSGVTGTDKAASKTGTETLTNKTLTSPVVNLGSDATGDIYYRNSGGTLSRLPVGSSSQILEVSTGGVPEWIANPSGSNASTTVKGVVEEATQVEAEAGTSTGATGARLYLNPSTAFPVGTIMMYGGATSPTAWLLCNGSAISRTTYANLFTVIGTSYGVGDGSTTFNIPDFRGKVGVGLNGATFSALGATGGEETHLLTGPESGIAAHSHSLNTTNGTGSTVDRISRGSLTTVGDNTGTAGPTNAANAHNNLQPYLTINYIIRF